MNMKSMSENWVDDRWKVSENSPVEGYWTKRDMSVTKIETLRKDKLNAQ